MLIVAGGLTAASGGYTAYNQYQQGVAQSKYYQYQANLARQEGQAALQRGERQSNLIQDSAKVEGKQLKTDQARFNASQRAALAAAGVTGVTAEDIAKDTLSREYLDEALLKHNADIKSWATLTDASYKNWAADVQATQMEYAGKNAKKAGKTEAISTLLSTAASVAMMGAGGFGSEKSTLSKFGGGTTKAKTPTNGWGNYSPTSFKVR